MRHVFFSASVNLQVPGLLDGLWIEEMRRYGDLGAHPVGPHISSPEPRLLVLVTFGAGGGVHNNRVYHGSECDDSELNITPYRPKALNIL